MTPGMAARIAALVVGAAALVRSTGDDPPDDPEPPDDAEEGGGGGATGPGRGWITRARSEWPTARAAWADVAAEHPEVRGVCRADHTESQYRWRVYR